MPENAKKINFPEKDFKEVKDIALSVIQSFPKAKSGKPYLTLKNGRKLFFDIFIKKYGVDGSKCNYTDLDIARRIRLVEFFDYFVKDYDVKYDGMSQQGKKMYVIENLFYRMVIINIGISISKFELLSFYHYK